MAALFILDLETDAATRRATLRLQDGDGRHLGAHQVALDDHAPSVWSGLFDTRRHVARMRDVETPEAHLAALGRFLGEHVLGGGIAAKLAEGVGLFLGRPGFMSRGAFAAGSVRLVISRPTAARRDIGRPC